MAIPATAVKQRRTELKLTQQEAARRADVSLATWRRFENDTHDRDDFDGFRADKRKGFARALKLSDTSLRQLITGTLDDDPTDEELSPGAAKIVTLFNTSFTGNPLTPADAMALSNTVDFSDFCPTRDGLFHADTPLGDEFVSCLKGEISIRDVPLLCDLPELALTHVNNHWLTRMGERIMRVGAELGEGRIPRPVCLADEYAIWIVITNTDAPQLGGVHDLFPGVLSAEDVFGYDPDFDDPDDESEGQHEWMNRMAGALLPPEKDHDFRRHDLTIMEHYGQGVYDPTDRRHPFRWFDRDDLRERCESEIAFVRLPKDEQDARTVEALNRAFPPQDT
ncbi:hypothetical protein CFN78_25555 [Amycolatopsis antarctica]|uniref:HTH cro/C1-type domain-containing protein n=1 Tax=Amycolatopsis antarctica TaxID=1854586 RepID=A0A263CWG4_9PSEU|nr:helix-turn-helix transcriptional regulator [Amycolatopsis antarctica]OZM70298.1 hypothetical protein CFN78_25555 [Amycolatopsis antarctica]